MHSIILCLKTSLMKLKNVQNATSLVANKKTRNPGKVLFLFAFSLYNIMFLTYTKFEQNLILGNFS